MSDAAPTIEADPVKQFSVFVENRLGRMFDLVTMLGAHDIHIMAMSTIDTTDSAINRMIVDDPDRTRELLAANNYPFTECDILCVELVDTLKLKDVLGALLAVEINIHYAYPFLMRPGEKSAIAFHLEDMDVAAESLSSRGFTVLRQTDISR